MSEQKIKRQRNKKEVNLNDNNNNVKMKVGSREDVWCGMALKTSGGLEKKDLMQNAKGKIVSIKKHERGKVLLEQSKQRNYGSMNDKENHEQEPENTQEVC